MQLTALQLIDCGANRLYVDRYVEPLNNRLAQYGITTPLRVAHLIAQLLHESCGFRYVREIADGSAYEGRKSLGNTQPGDGKRFRGRGLIQLTGRFNYATLSKAFKVDYITHPEWLERPDDAVHSALWYWNDRQINRLADADDLVRVTKAINGGTNGLASRQAYLEKTKLVFGVTAVEPVPHEHH